MRGTKLSINLNKIALLRNSRGRDYPSVEGFAKKALDNGVDGITMHPRPDQRHARYSDLFKLKTLLQQYPKAELNIEGYPTPEFLDVVLEIKPAQCTLVPDSPDQITSDHGWNIDESNKRLIPIIQSLRQSGIRVSLFMDPDPSQISLVKSTGADRIELYTEEYAVAFEQKDKVEKICAVYQDAAAIAINEGVGVNAGHDLNLENLGKFLTIDSIDEVSIGHAIIVESLESMGFEKVIKNYVKIIQTSNSENS
ncbi:MAG: pyridoxine 5'-phosphate synthase [Proteobacteria bacterium]|nr:pyridoxine 5'-phosphate synthase [Pseudomonadota bacterium]